MSELEILRKAIDTLELQGDRQFTISRASNWLGVTAYTSTTSSPSIFPQLVPQLIRMLSETAEEFETDAVGRTAIVVCQHCYDNINVARLVLGMEPIDFMVDP